MKRFLLISAALITLLITAVVMAFVLYARSDIPAAPLEALRHAESYELLSLEPDELSPPTPDLFHNWTVLGRTLVADQDTRDQLTTALRRSARMSAGAEKVPVMGA